MSGDAPQTRGIQDQTIDSLLGRFGEIGTFLRPIIEMSIGNALRAHVGGTPYGGTGLFGQQNVGANLVDYFNQRTLQVSMQGTQQTLEAQRQEFRVSMQQTMGLTRDRAVAAGAGFNLTNFAADTLFNQLQPGYMQAGLQQALGLAGVRAPLGLSGEALRQQLDINRQGREVSTRLMQDYLTNFSAYSGMTGRDVGQLTAEAARTGQLRLTGDMSTAAINRLTNDTIGATRSMAQVVGAGRAFFQGSALDVLDQMNAITGMNFARSLGPQQATQTLAQMSAAARVNLLEPGQMVALADQSAAFSRAMNREPFGAFGAAASIASHYASAVQQNQPFVNEQRLRETLVRRVTGAQESDVARAISGAAMALPEGQRDDFVERVRRAGVGGQLTLPRLASIANQMGAPGTGYDFLMQGYTEGAEQFRATGAATNAVMASNLGRIGAMRRRFASAVLGIDERRLGNASTLDEMHDRPGMANVFTPTRMGELTRVFNRDAQNMGYGSMRELDATLLAQADVARQQRTIQRQTFIETGLVQLGRNRGVLGLISFVNQVRQGGKQATLQAALQNFMGEDTNLRWDDPALAGKDGALTKWLEEAGGGQGKKSGDRELFLGLDVLALAMQTGTMGEEQLTPEKMKTYRQILSSAPTDATREIVRGLVKYAPETQRRQAREWEISKDIGNARGDKKLTPEALSREAALRAGAEGLEDANKDLAKGYLEEVKKSPGLTAEEYAKRGEDESTKIGRLRSAIETQAVIGAAGALDTRAGGLEGPLAIIAKLFSSIVDSSSGSVKVADARKP
jgi:hypothetical protein